MLGERIAELRKNKGISQEELADVLMTSRQAISKWERGESDPDIGRLKDLAVYFNVSIDYLLGYDIETESVNAFAERVKKCHENATYDISLEDVKRIVSRNSNNFHLIFVSISYLSEYYYITKEMAVLDLLIQYLKKAILLFQPNSIYDTNLNNLHLMLASAYELKGEHELAKNYVKENQIIESEALVSRCEFALGHFDEVEKITSSIFLNSIGLLIESNATQARVFLRTNRIQEALDLSDWSINFIKSVGKNEENFLDIVFAFSFIKASCEKALGLDYSKPLQFLKENRDKTKGFNSINNGFKFYSSNNVIITSETGDIKSDLLKEITVLKKNNIKGYQCAFDIFNEVYGE